MNGDCKDYEDSLVLYHYGELPAEDTARVESHLASCAVCREELSRIAETVRLVPSHAPMAWETSKAVEGVMEAVRPAKKAWHLGHVPAYLAAAAAVIAIFVATYEPGTYTAKAPVQTEVAQADWEVLENYDVVKDLDVIEELDTLDSFDENM